MSIIKPKPKLEKTQCRIHIDNLLLQEIKHYCEYAGFKKIDDFFEEAASHIFMKDRAFKEWKETIAV